MKKDLLMTDIEGPSWLHVVIAIAVVSGLLGLLAHGLKYIAQHQIRIPGLRTSTRRLEIIENLPLDARRRLAIIRCDNREHLLLLGTEQDILIEANLEKLDKSTLEIKDLT